MYAKLVRGGYRSDDCWSWVVRDADNDRWIDGGRNWWLRSDFAAEELRKRYPTVELRI